MDPTLTSDNKPYAPQRFQEIIKERYLISKYSNTSYLDTAKISPRERNAIVKMIYDELKKQKELIEQQKSHTR